jgi:hypothetical protein
MPDADARAYINYLQEHKTIVHTATLEWHLVAVKHLVLLNGAGLAAATTVMAGNASNSLRYFSSLAASACGIGLLFAVTVTLMIWRWIYGRIQLENVSTYMSDFAHDRKQMHDHQRLSLGLFGRRAEVIFSLMSLSCFAGAMVAIFVVARHEMLLPKPIDALVKENCTFHLPGESGG